MTMVYVRWYRSIVQGEVVENNCTGLLEGMVADLRKALEGTDTEAIKRATETLTEKSYEVFGKIYQQQQQQGQQPPHAPNDGTSYGPNEGGDDNVVDADYEVVK